jgi:hypothetical protein
LTSFASKIVKVSGKRDVVNQKLLEASQSSSQSCQAFQNPKETLQGQNLSNATATSTTFFPQTISTSSQLPNPLSTISTSTTQLSPIRQLFNSKAVVPTQKEVSPHYSVSSLIDCHDLYECLRHITSPPKERIAKKSHFVAPNILASLKTRRNLSGQTSRKNFSVFVRQVFAVVVHHTIILERTANFVLK